VKAPAAGRACIANVRRAGVTASILTVLIRCGRANDGIWTRLFSRFLLCSRFAKESPPVRVEVAERPRHHVGALGLKRPAFKTSCWTGDSKAGRRHPGKSDGRSFRRSTETATLVLARCGSCKASDNPSPVRAYPLLLPFPEAFSRKIMWTRSARRAPSWRSKF
jgi:hypothetical protein